MPQDLPVLGQSVLSLDVSVLQRRLCYTICRFCSTADYATPLSFLFYSRILPGRFFFTSCPWAFFLQQYVLPPKSKKFQKSVWELANGLYIIKHENLRNKKNFTLVHWALLVYSSPKPPPQLVILSRQTATRW
jgi:hypothetical protein